MSDLRPVSLQLKKLLAARASEREVPSPESLRFSECYRSPEWQRLPPKPRGLHLLVAERAKPAVLVHRHEVADPRLLWYQAQLGLVCRRLGPNLQLLLPAGELVDGLLPRIKGALTGAANGYDPGLRHWFMGAMLGYPECCIRAYVAQATRSTGTAWTCLPVLRLYIQLRHRYCRTGSYPQELDYTFIGGVPCHPDCSEALQDCRTWRDLLERADPGAAVALAQRGRATRALVTVGADAWERFLDHSELQWRGQWQDCKTAAA